MSKVPKPKVRREFGLLKKFTLGTSAQLPNSMFHLRMRKFMKKIEIVG